MKTVPLLLFAVTVVLLSGCDRLGGNWLVGKWTLDKETTIANLSAGDPEAPDSPKFLALQEKVLARCPVLTMYAKSGLQIDLKWSAVAE